MISIAIDGPSGVGKSTVAKAIGVKLGYIYIDSGAIYRAIALYNIKQYGKIEETPCINSLKQINIELSIINNTQHIFLNGSDVTKDIRLNDVSNATSEVSKIFEVRAFVNSLLVQYINNKNIIMDGRDIGTVVMPNATVKIYLFADVKERALRRYTELASKGVDTTYDTVLNGLIERDRNDTTRINSPLKKADDAFEVDSTSFVIEQTVEAIIKIIEGKIGNNNVY